VEINRTSVINLTWDNLKSNSDVCGERRATYHVSHDATLKH